MALTSRAHVNDGTPLGDNSGPQGLDPRKGLPKLRKSWVERRERKGDATPTQMWYAKQGAYVSCVCVVGITWWPPG